MRRRRPRAGARLSWTRKRTYTHLIRGMRTLRFLVTVRAGRLARIDGRHVLRLSQRRTSTART